MCVKSPLKESRFENKRTVIASVSPDRSCANEFHGYSCKVSIWLIDGVFMWPYNMVVIFEIDKMDRGV